MPNPIPCWDNEMKRRFRLGMSMLLTRFLLLGQVFWTLSWNYYFRYQYCYSIGGNQLLWSGISSRPVWRFNKSLNPIYKKKSSSFCYTFISHTRSWTWASRVKARCTMPLHILSWTDWNVKIMFVYMKQVLQTCKKQLDWATAETPAKIVENSRPPACYFQGNSWKL